MEEVAVSGASWLLDGGVADSLLAPGRPLEALLNVSPSLGDGTGGDGRGRSGTSAVCSLAPAVITFTYTATIAADDDHRHSKLDNEPVNNLSGYDHVELTNG